MHEIEIYNCSTHKSNTMFLMNIFIFDSKHIQLAQIHNYLGASKHSCYNHPDYHSIKLTTVPIKTMYFMHIKLMYYNCIKLISLEMLL